MNFSFFQKAFNREFKKRYSAYLKRRNVARLPFTKKLYSELEQYVLNGGKRVRPLLLFISAEQLTSDNRFKKTNLDTQNYLWDFAIGIELVHSGMLIHDDIMDGDTLRRGKPAMHELVGVSQAITIGDVSWSLGYDFMLNSDSNYTLKEKAILNFLNFALLAGEGQILDLHFRDKKTISKRELFHMYEIKTAGYSFVAPLVMGAILGSKDKHIHTYRKIGENLGILFQLHDDILDQHHENHSVLNKTHMKPQAEKDKLLKGLHDQLKKSTLAKTTKLYLENLLRILYE